MSAEARIPVPLAWREIEHVRTCVRKELGGLPQELVESAVTAASELAENLVKYGKPLPGESQGLLTLRRDGTRIRLRTVNAATRDDVDRIRSVLAELATPGGPAAAYRRRLQHLLDHPDDSACGLGLLRIAYEGAFELRVQYSNDRLELRAERDIQRSEAL